jgi:hypothetical protein
MLQKSFDIKQVAIVYSSILRTCRNGSLHFFHVSLFSAARNFFSSCCNLRNAMKSSGHLVGKKKLCSKKIQRVREREKVGHFWPFCVRLLFFSSPQPFFSKDWHFTRACVSRVFYPAQDGFVGP